MDFYHLVRKHRSTILREWVDCILRTYPAETYDFINRKRDNLFMQTVGGVFECSCAKILDGIIEGWGRESLLRHIDEIVRIRAVQEFSPSEAVGFFLDLKEIIRKTLHREIEENNLYGALFEIEAKIDDLCKAAFDVFMECRERIYELKANELRNWTYRIIENSGMVRQVSPES